MKICLRRKPRNIDVTQTEEDAPFDLDTAPPEIPIPEDWEDIKEIENIVKQGLAYGSLAIGVPSSGYALYNAWQKTRAAAKAHRAAKGTVERAKLQSSGQLTPIRDFGIGAFGAVVGVGYFKRIDDNEARIERRRPSDWKPQLID